MIAKAGLGLIGLSAISVGGVALAKPHLLGMDYMPSWHSLSEDNGYPGSDYGSGKFGNKYSKYLVGVTHKGTETTKTNKAWWEWAFRRLEKGNLNKGKFKDLKSENGKGVDDLKKLCEEAYKLTDDTTSFGDDGTKHNKSDVWKYCSPGKLTTTSEGANTDSYVDTQIGGNNDNKTKLISVKNSDNDWFWKIRNEEFWGSDTSSNLSGSKASENSLFKNEYRNKSNSSTPRKTIKQLCGDAYLLTKTDKENDSTDANKFCKLETN